MMGPGAEELMASSDADAGKLMPAGSTHSTADMISTDGEFEERLPLDDDDIEKAAEQVVDEWTNRLQGVDEALYDEAQEKEDEVGTMNPDLPAGGYEEVVMGFDTENGEVIEEEIVDESYSEEEIVEDTTDDEGDMIVDDVVREAMGEAAGIGNVMDQECGAPPEQDIGKDDIHAPSSSPTFTHGDGGGSGQVQFADDAVADGTGEDDNYDYVEQTIRDDDFVEGVDGQILETEPSNITPQEDAQEQTGSAAREVPTVDAEHMLSAAQYQDDADMANQSNSMENVSVEDNDYQNEEEAPVQESQYEGQVPTDPSIDDKNTPESHEPLISSYGSIAVNQEDLDQAYETYEEPEAGYETFGDSNAITKPEPYQQQQQQTEVKAAQPGRSNMPQVVVGASADDVNIAPTSDIESGTSTTPVPEQDKKYDDDDEYGSSGDEYDDDDGFFSCLVFLACICLVGIILAIVLPIVLTRRKKSPATLTPTIAPTTASPTMSPTNIVFDWVSSVDNVHGPEFSQFGTAIALQDNFYIAGAPDDSDTGAVYTALFDGTNWNLIPPLYGEADGDSFGAAVDTTDGYMIVGAPSRKVNGTLTEVGQAYLYLFQSATDVWLQVGPNLQGDEDIFAAGGEFGRSVAVGSGLLPRVVVGAPRHSVSVDSLENGRVYTFESSAKSWQSLDDSPILGKNADDWFGSAVDMSDSAERFIVGAPGANNDASGYIQIYEWKGDQWVVDFEATGDAGDNFGTAVFSVPGADDTFIVGAPGYRNGRGRILVYRRLSALTYIQVGPEIVGDVNENLGSSGSINGGIDEDTLVLVFASQEGTVKTYRFDPSSTTWLQQGIPLETGHSTINIDYSDEDGLLVSDLDTDKALLYEPSLVSVTSIHSYDGPPNRPITTQATTTQAPTIVPVPDDTATGFGIVEDGS